MTSLTNKILYATGLSASSHHGMRYVVNLAKATGAEIHVLHVSEPISEDARVTMRMFIQDPKARKEALTRRLELTRESIADLMDSFWASVSDADAGVRSQVRSVDVIEGYPAEIILRESINRNCDLVVLGAHDHGFTHTFLGTVAKRVLRRSQIPTLIVPSMGET